VDEADPAVDERLTPVDDTPNAVEAGDFLEIVGNSLLRRVVKTP
jgi:hypothetical protein